MLQTKRTKNFIKAVNSVIENGEAKDYTSIVIKLKWNATSMTNVLKGRRNVPNEIYTKFAKFYNIDKANEENQLFNEDQAPYGHTIIELLALLRMEKESLKKEQENLGKAHDTIRLLIEREQPPDMSKAQGA